MFKMISGLPDSTRFSTFLGQRSLFAGKRTINLKSELVRVTPYVSQSSKSAARIAVNATAGGVLLSLFGLGAVIGAVAGGAATASKQTITFTGELVDGTTFTAQADPDTLSKIVACVTSARPAIREPDSAPKQTAIEKPGVDFQPVGRRDACTFSSNIGGKINSRCNACGAWVVVPAESTKPFSEGFLRGYRVPKPVKCANCGALHQQINRL